MAKLTKHEVIQILSAEYKVPEDKLQVLLTDYPDDVTEGAKVESREEAFALFEEFRKGIIDCFRETAFAMLQTREWVAARQVINQMKINGTYKDFGNDCWSGVALTRDSRFEQCGTVHLEGEAYGVASKAGRRAHGAYTVGKWRLCQAEPASAKEVLNIGG